MPKGKKKSKNCEAIPLRTKLLTSDNHKFFHTLKLSQPLSIRERKEVLEKVNKHGLFLELIVIGDLEGIQVLVEKLNISPNFCHNSCVPIMTAAEYGQLEIFKYLVEKGGNIDQNKEKTSPLFYALANNRQNIIAYMVDQRKAKKCHFEINTLQNDSFYPPLHSAIIRGYHVIAEKLLELEDIDLKFQDRNKGNAIILCANNSYKGKFEQIKIAKALIKRGVDVYHQNIDGLDALMIFVARGCFLGLQLLIDHHIENNKDNPKKALQEYLNRKDKLGRTAVHSAGHSGDFDCLRLLVSAGAQIDQPTKNGLTVLMEAAWGMRKDKTPIEAGWRKYNEFLEKCLQGIESVCPITREKILVKPNVHLIDHQGGTFLIHLLNIAVLYKQELEINKLTVVVRLIKKVITLTNDFNRNVYKLKENDKLFSMLTFAIFLKDKSIISILLEKGADIGFLVRKNWSNYRMSASTAYKTTFPILLKHKLTKLCLTIANANTAIEHLLDYLLGNKEASDQKEISSYRVMKDDSLLLHHKSGENIVLLDEDVPLVVQKIKSLNDRNVSISPSEITTILFETLKDTKQKSLMNNRNMHLTELNHCIRSITTLIADLQFLNDMIFSIDVVHDLNDEISETEKLKISEYFAKNRVEIENILTIQKKFYTSIEEDKANFLKYIDSDEIKLALEILERMKGTFSALTHSREVLQKINLSLSGMDSQKNKTKIKEKTKGVSAEEIIQEKIKEFAARCQLNPELQIATTIVNAGNGNDLSSSISSREATIQSQKLLEQLDELTKMGKRPDEQLKLLPIQNIQTNDSKNSPDSSAMGERFDFFGGQFELNEESELPGFSDFPELSDRLQELDLKDEQDHKRSKEWQSSNNMEQLNIAGRAKVADHLDLFKKILNAKIENWRQCSSKDLEFLMESALFGAFARLMEELKKFKDPKIFSPSVARKLRNFIFHEEGALSTFVDPASELKPLCEKLLVHLDSIRDSKQLSKKDKMAKKDKRDRSDKKDKGNKKNVKVSNNIETFLKEIDSKFFNMLIKMALEKDFPYQTPSVDICLSQIKQAENELERFKTICIKHAELMDDPNFFAILRIGLGRTCARLACYVSAMQQYPEEFRAHKLYRYLNFIKLGILYRHGDEALADEKGKSERDKDQTINLNGSEMHRETWMQLTDELIAELMLDYMSDRDNVSGNAPSFLPAFQASLEKPLSLAEALQLNGNTAAPVITPI